MLDAVIAALTAANAAPFTLGDLARRTVPPDYYNEVVVTPMYIGVYDAAGMPLVDGWRISTRAVAKTEGNAIEMRRRCLVALRGQRMGDSSPVLLESPDPVIPDDGWYSGQTTFTCSS